MQVRISSWGNSLAGLLQLWDQPTI